MLGLITKDGSHAQFVSTKDSRAKLVEAVTGIERMMADPSAVAALMWPMCVNPSGITQAECAAMLKAAPKRAGIALCALLEHILAPGGDAELRQLVADSEAIVARFDGVAIPQPPIAEPPAKETKTKP